jgi:hypothetical protein
MAIRGRERTAWQDVYAIQQTSNILHCPRYDTTDDVGILGSGGNDRAFFLLKLTDHPHFTRASQSLEQELTVGLSQRREDEYNIVSSELAGVTLNMQAHAWNLSLFLRGLFQEGAHEDLLTGITPNLYHCSARPYWIPDVTNYMGSTRALDQANGTYHPHGSYVDPTGLGVGTQDRMSHFMIGMVPRSIALTAEEGNILQMAVDCAGAHSGVMNTAGILDKRWFITRRLRVLPTPSQLGISPGSGITNFGVWHNGVPFANVSVVASEEDFSEVATDSVEVAADTGNVHFSDADAAAYHGQLIHHDAYKRHSGSWLFNHPFDLLPDMKAPLLWQNAIIKMRRIDPQGNENGNWRDVHLPGFSLTMNNNLVGHFYNEPIVYKYLLGRFTAEGSVTIPWGTDKEDLSAGVGVPTFGGNDPLIQFVAGWPMRLRVYWGQTNHVDTELADDYDINLTDPAGTRGYHAAVPEREGAVVIDQAIRYTDQNIEGENELGQAMTYTLVEDLGRAEDAPTTNKVLPDPDRTRALRIGCSYKQDELDRGMNTSIPGWP